MAFLTSFVSCILPLTKSLVKSYRYTQSIRNKTGEPYRALIKSFEDNTDKNSSKSKKYKGKLDWIEEISDVRLKILVGHQAAQLAQAKRTKKEFTPPDMVININDGLAVQTDSFTPLEKMALEYLTSNEFIEKWDFKKGSHGDILNDKGDKVFKIATIDAIEKALKNL